MKDPTIPQDYTSYKADTGEIVQWGFGLPIVETGEDWIEGAFHSNSFYVVDNAAIARPESFQPVLVGNVLSVAGLPPETTIVLRNEAGDTLVMRASDGDITFNDSGIYRIEVNPPFPHRHLTAILEIV